MRLTVSPVLRAALLLIATGTMFLPQAFAQYSGDAAMKPLGAVAQGGLPSYLQHAGIDQNLNHALPLTASFTDSAGATVPLGHYFGQRPVMMALVYYSCGLLCPQVLHGMADSLKQTGFRAGKDYDVVVVSFDPKDTPAESIGKKQLFLSWMGPTADPSGVHFLTGQQASIDALTHAVGFHYVRVPGPDGKMDQFAHSSVIMIATPDGRLSKYLAGIQYQSRDVRLALVQASNHKIGSATDLILLYCCNYSPTSGKYTVSILRVMSIAGAFTLIIVIGMIFLLSRKPQGRNFPGGPPPDAQASA
ncbi:MAG TPA: SCO family protein [Acidobacteriaceae bacterium]|jgi:protein SCO1/2|nr:SCO family protein [Acidobacteriaceae bacterium]